MPTVDIPLPSSARYEVRVEGGLLARLGQQVHQVAAAPSCAIISDSNVAPLYLPAARASLEAAGYRVMEFVFPAGEAHKTIQTVGRAWDHFLSSKVERATPVVALGGGVVGDLAGLVAATLLRGVPFIQVPTTLLASVDASVGGKVGVDHAVGKNLIGAFHQPRLVLTDLHTFHSLPPREILCGLAECIKHGIIRDEKLFSFIEENLSEILKRDEVVMAELVAWNVRIKAEIVQQDPYEKGVRALLNLGHTFGHALETLSHYSGLQHGEAVGLGMLAAARLARRLSLMERHEVERIEALIARSGLPTSLPTVNADAVLAAMASDKKVLSGQLRLVLPTGLGSAKVVGATPTGDVRWAVETLAG